MKDYRDKIALWLICLLAVACTTEEQGFIDDDGIGDVYRKKSQELCEQSWINTYQDDTGKHYTEKLEFDIGRNGKESIIIKFTDGVILTAIGYFVWHWSDEQQNTLQIEYSSTDIIYFTDVRTQNGVLQLYSEEDESNITYLAE